MLFVTCPVCGGDGWADWGVPCILCGGSGEIENEKNHA